MLKLPEILETERLYVRRFQESDFPLFASFMTDKEATQYMLFNPEQKTFQGARQLLDRTIRFYDTERQIFALAVAEKETNRFVGSVGLAPDFNGKGIQIYWAIIRSKWAKGYATEATRKLLEYAFNELGYDQVVAYSNPDNAPSRRVAEKVGFTIGEIVDIPGMEQKAQVFTIKKSDL